MYLIGGSVAERLLRNRGRTRTFVAKKNFRILRQRLMSFLNGQWKPSAVSRITDYSISLTSWSARIDYLQLTLVLLIDQDVRPDGIYVWLTRADLEQIPIETRDSFEAHGVIFCDCLDYRSHKKWLPMILSGHQKPFVICDDDIFYPRDWFGRLTDEDRGDTYLGCKCHMIAHDNSGNILPYSMWQKQIYRSKVHQGNLFATGCGGVVIHPSRLPDTALDFEKISQLCLYSDDIWLNAAHLSVGIPVSKTRYNFPCLELPGTAASGLLLNHNTIDNDNQIAATWDFFGLKGIDCNSR